MIAGPDLANEIVQTKKLFYDSPKTEMFRALILKGLEFYATQKAPEAAGGEK